MGLPSPLPLTPPPPPPPPAMEVNVIPAYVGVGCNRVVHAAAWGRSNLIAFGAQNFVAICDSKTAQIVATLPGHGDRVNCVEWLPRHQNLAHGLLEPLEDILLSGASDGSLILWTRGFSSKWSRALHFPSAHKKAILCISSCLLPSHCAIAAVCSADNTVSLWKIKMPSSSEGQYSMTLQQTIPVGVYCMQAASLSPLGEWEENGLDLEKSPTTPLVLALGGLDNLVHLYTATSPSHKFIKACVLRGHQDWIRSLDFSAVSFSSSHEKKSNTDSIQEKTDESVPETTVFLASASQDRNIRIWKIHISGSRAETENDDFHSKLGLYSKGANFQLQNQMWQTSLESLLVGHEDWVLSVRWCPPLKKKRRMEEEEEEEEDEEESFLFQPMSLLSASMDRTMMIWRPEKSGLWLNEVNVGELVHTSLGFYGGLWGPEGDSIVAHGYGGSLHMWRHVFDEGEGREFREGEAQEKREAMINNRLDREEEGEEGREEEEVASKGTVCGRERERELRGEWRPQRVVSGHFGPVVDMDWDKTGHFLLTASHDQTVRIIASWDPKAGGRREGEWHEIARPQIHGHDLTCLTFLKGSGPHRYVSGAEEKVARVFISPSTFLDTLRYTWQGENATAGVSMTAGTSEEVLGANMSALGLSQKPIYATGGGEQTVVTEAGTESMDPIPEAVPKVVSEPPLEEHLAQNTLWPETHKLYGHGNELWCMAGDRGGRILATASKAQSPAVAAVWLWDSASWRPLGQLASHNLTVTQMEFSRDDQFLLTVSRDRHLALWERKTTVSAETNVANSVPGQQAPYELAVKVEAHKRIVWTASWAPSGGFFATGSRDKSVKVWKVFRDSRGAVNIQAVASLKCSSSVTAVAWAPNQLSPETHILAVGMEDGSTELWHGTVVEKTGSGNAGQEHGMGEGEGRGDDGKDGKDEEFMLGVNSNLHRTSEETKGISFVKGGGEREGEGEGEGERQESWKLKEEEEGRTIGKEEKDGKDGKGGKDRHEKEDKEREEGFSIEMKKLTVFNPFICHVAAVHRLRWRDSPPLEIDNFRGSFVKGGGEREENKLENTEGRTTEEITEERNEERREEYHGEIKKLSEERKSYDLRSQGSKSVSYQLASCGADHSVRLFTVCFTK